MSITDPTIRRAAAAPLMWNRPRLRFIEGAADEGASEQDATTADDASDNASNDDSAEQNESSESQEDTEFDSSAALAKIRKANQEAKSLRDRAKAAEKTASESKADAEKVPALEADLLRLRVALKHGLTEDLAKRLVGTTEEELLADAESLLSMFGGAKRPPSEQPKERLRGGGDPTKSTADPTADLDAFAEDAFKR